MIVGARLTRNGSDEIMVSIASDAGTLWTGGVERALNGLSDKDMVWDGTDSNIKLILSRRIIELHGGHLWIGGGQSQPVAFAFTLPVTGTAAHSCTDNQASDQTESMV